MSSQDLNEENDIVEILKNANQLGSIEGIYAIANANQSMQDTLFYNLDKVSRQYCTDLRYITVWFIKHELKSSVCISTILVIILSHVSGTLQW